MYFNLSTLSLNIFFEFLNLLVRKRLFFTLYQFYIILFPFFPIFKDNILIEVIKICNFFNIPSNKQA